MTHESIVYERRVRLIEYAARVGNVAEACRVFGVSRNTYYEWIKKAEVYGLSALLPRGSTSGRTSPTRCRVRKSR